MYGRLFVLVFSPADMSLYPLFPVTRMIVIPARLLLDIMLSCEPLNICFCSPKVTTDFQDQKRKILCRGWIKNLG
jgi:hypothetical protein